MTLRDELSGGTHNEVLLTELRQKKSRNQNLYKKV